MATDEKVDASPLLKSIIHLSERLEQLEGEAGELRHCIADVAAAAQKLLGIDTEDE